MFLLLVLPGGAVAAPPEDLNFDFPETEIMPETSPMPAAEYPASPASSFFSALRPTFRVEGLSAWNLVRNRPEPGTPDWRGLSRIRLKTEGELTGMAGERLRFMLKGHAASDGIFAFRGKEEAPDPIRSDAVWDADMDEAWVSLRLSPETDLYTGRQVLVWGTADLLRVVDVLNPLDLREPGLCEVKDLRIPVWMSRIRHRAGIWTLTGVAVHEIRHHKLPSHGSDFAPPVPLPPEDTRKSALPETEFGLSATAAFSGWDLGLYAASRHEDTAVTLATPSENRRRHPRASMAGASLSACKGNWILVMESSLTWNTGFDAVPSGVRKREGMIGVDYAGFRDTEIRLESALADHEGVPPDLRNRVFQMACRMEKKFFRDTLSVAVQGQAFGPHAKEGGFLRGEVTRRISDTLRLTLGAVLYTSGIQPGYATIGDNDRLFLRIRWEH